MRRNEKSKHSSAYPSPKVLRAEVGLVVSLSEGVHTVEGSVHVTHHTGSALRLGLIPRVACVRTSGQVVHLALIQGQLLHIVDEDLHAGAHFTAFQAFDCARRTDVHFTAVRERVSIMVC